MKSVGRCEVSALDNVVFPGFVRYNLALPTSYLG